jgi:hypothetical protein
MAEPDDREAASRRYRELPAEEPPAALDAAIRAHARRAVSRRQWYFPLAAAAILVLAVAVTWQVEREQPDMVAVVPAEPQAERVMKDERFAATAPEQKADAPARPAESDRADREVGGLAKQSRPMAQSAPAPQESPAPRAERRVMREQAAKAESPEAWLERIAKLRAEGKHEEADKALAEFRKRYPDFRIAPEVRERVEKK